MPNRYQLNRGDEVVVYFTSENAAPYMFHGKYIGENDDHYIIVGTVGEHIGKDAFIPKDGVKMIERLDYARQPVSRTGHE